MYQQPRSFINKAINALNNLSVIQAIFDVVIGTYGNKLSIAYPKIVNDKNRIYFIIDSTESDIVSLKGKIKDILEFDYSKDDDGKQDVILLNTQFATSPNYIALLADDITPFSPQNIKDVQEFLKRHYKQYLDNYKKNETPIIEAQKNTTSSFMKDQSTGSNLNFWDKSSSDDVDINDILDCLKTNPKVFKAFLETPSNWDKLSKPMQEKLKEVREKESSLITGSPKSVPVK